MILVAGEALVDVLRRPDGSEVAVPGGSPANVAVGLGRLALDVELATTLGNDRHGKLLREHLDASGVRLLRGLRTPAQTPYALADLGADGSANYTFEITWNPGEIQPAREPDLVHSGSIATLLEPGADEVLTLLRTQRQHGLITFDPNVRTNLISDPNRARQRIDQIVQLADVVKVSNEDLRWYDPMSSAEDIARSWLGAGPAGPEAPEAGPAAVMVTGGAAGSSTFFARGVIDVAASAQRVVDTVGAGDAFMSGTIAAILREGITDAAARSSLHNARAEFWQRVSDLAARSAGIVVERAGAQPPWRSELLGPQA